MNRQHLRSVLGWGSLVIMGLIAFNLVSEKSGVPKGITFSEFREHVSQGHVESIVIQDIDVSGEYTADYQKETEGNEQFTTTGPVGEDLQDVLMARGIKYTFKKTDENSLWQQILVTSIPLLLLVIVLIFIMRQFQGGSGKAMSFGKSKARLLNEGDNKITFNDIAGIDEAKEELQEIVGFLKNPKKFTRLGGRIPKGVLLMGSPGTGKTLLARGVAGEANVPFFSISGSDFVEMFVGVGASRVRDLFEQAKKQAPCIVFIDEIDAVGRHRGAGLGGGHDEREQTLNQLLVEMDGFESNEGVILIAATNRPDVLDPALLRPGRFDRRVVVASPDVRGRELILKIHTRKTPVDKDVDLSTLAKGTPGFSGADLENLVNEAALQAARCDKDVLQEEDFEHAKDKVLMGAERKSAVISEKERKVTAFHEAGHALVAILQENTDPVHKVTIIPRGRALGVTQQLPSEDRYTLTRVQALNRLAVMMGGRAAEKICFDQITTGAGNDIEVATGLARRMVCEWGMSDAVGPLAYGEGDSNPFVGYHAGKTTRPYSESVAEEIDSEVKRIITEQYKIAEEILNGNRELLDLMSEALLEFEVLNQRDIKSLMDTLSLDAIRSDRLAKEVNVSKPKTRSPKTGYSSRINDWNPATDPS